MKHLHPLNPLPLYKITKNPKRPKRPLRLISIHKTPPKFPTETLSASAPEEETKKDQKDEDKVFEREEERHEPMSLGNKINRSVYRGDNFPVLFERKGFVGHVGDRPYEQGEESNDDSRSRKSFGSFREISAENIRKITKKQYNIFKNKQTIRKSYSQMNFTKLNKQIDNIKIKTTKPLKKLPKEKLNKYNLKIKTKRQRLDKISYINQNSIDLLTKDSSLPSLRPSTGQENGKTNSKSRFPSNRFSLLPSKTIPPLSHSPVISFPKHKNPHIKATLAFVPVQISKPMKDFRNRQARRVTREAKRR